VIVNVALPSIGRGFGSGMTGLQWVVDGYALTFAASLLSADAISDRIGARQAFAGGLGLFVVASAACGTAPDPGVLVAARLVQAVGAAMVVPSSLALLREIFPDPAEGARAIALWGVSGCVGAAAGPVAGGLTYAAIEAGPTGSAPHWSCRMRPERRLQREDLPVGAVSPAGARAECARHRRGLPADEESVPADRVGVASGVLNAAAIVGVTVLATLRPRPAPRV
jgi:MFS family permease